MHYDACVPRKFPRGKEIEHSINIHWKSEGRKCVCSWRSNIEGPWIVRQIPCKVEYWKGFSPLDKAQVQFWSTANNLLSYFKILLLFWLYYFELKIFRTKAWEARRLECRFLAFRSVHFSQTMNERMTTSFLPWKSTLKIFNKVSYRKMKNVIWKIL